MRNLLKADLYKLKRSKSFIICLITIALFVTYVILDFSSSAHRKEQLSQSTFHWIYTLFNEKAFLPYFIPLLQSIFITMLITNEYSTGTIKDSVSLGYNRIKVYLSKLITISIATFIMMFIAIFFIGITSIFVFGIYGNFTFFDLLLMIRMFLIHGLLYTSYASIFILIAYLIKNIGATMAFSIFFSLILGSLGTLLGSSSIGRALLLMNFSPTGVPHPQIIDIIIAILVALSYLIICSVIGIYLFKKQDIK